MDTFSLFPLNQKDNPETMYLDPTQTERVHIPPGPPPEQPADERLKNFNMVFLGYAQSQAVVEATRCIHCPATEPCIIGCPVHNDIPKALFAIENGEFDKAAGVFRLTSNFPEVCGRLCPQEVLCEGSCTVAGYDRAVNIGKLEAFCTDWQRNHGGFPMPPELPSTGRRVAVIGSGPAGIAVAEQLTLAGHMVVVYEEWPKPGGLLHYGIPDFKLDKGIVQQKIAHLEAIGVKFICNTRVGRDIELDKLQEQYDAVFLGIGAPVGNRPSLPGEDLEGVYQATEFLVRGNLPPEDLPDSMKGLPELAPAMAVIGGGDTAADCVRTAVRLQAQHGFANGSVVDYYRGAEHEMRTREDDLMHAKKEGVRYEFLASPVRFIGDEHGHVRQIEFQRMMTRPADQPEQRVPSRLRVPIPGSNFLVPADVVVLAIGYTGDEFIPSKTPALKTTKPGIFQVESETTGAATLKGVYAAGDDVRGADLIVTAIAAGRKAAQAMDAYLRSLA
ncbi:MAG TPA: NAD(P)-dependent oxidoreductase [Anaerolineales bacterium]|nr:NAD(P)-dependent oxidoreductase [Anaerolineales bacterium]